MTFFEWLRQLTMKERAVLAAQTGYAVGTLNFAIHHNSGISEYGIQVIYETALAQAGPTKKGGTLTHKAAHDAIRVQRAINLDKARERAANSMAMQ